METGHGGGRAYRATRLCADSTREAWSGAPRAKHAPGGLDSCSNSRKRRLADILNILWLIADDVSMLPPHNGASRHENFAERSRSSMEHGVPSSYNCLDLNQPAISMPYKTGYDYQRDEKPPRLFSCSSCVLRLRHAEVLGSRKRRITPRFSRVVNKRRLACAVLNNEQPFFDKRCSLWIQAGTMALSGETNSEARLAKRSEDDGDIECEGIGSEKRWFP